MYPQIFILIFPMHTFREEAIENITLAHKATSQHVHIHTYTSVLFIVCNIILKLYPYFQNEHHAQQITFEPLIYL